MKDSQEVFKDNQKRGKKRNDEGSRTPWPPRTAIRRVTT